ncbi:MAG: hypothetical protein ACJAVF_002239 [Paraglaciecola sp.]|jgi:hypothetical protein
MLQKIFTSLLIAIFSMTGFAQKPAGNQAEFEKAYERRIRKDVLHGVYIPKDLTDAFIELNRKIDAESKIGFKAYPEDQVADQLFYSFGRWMIHNWGFYAGSRLSAYIKDLGIYHPEDMARFIIIAYHRNLNMKFLDIKELMKIFHEKQNKEKEELINSGEILHQQTRTREGGG